MALKSGATDGLRQPANHCLLDDYGSRTGAPGGYVLVEHACQQVGKGGDGFSRSQNVAEEAGILGAGTSGQVLNLVENCLPDSLLWQRRIEQTNRFLPI